MADDLAKKAAQAYTRQEPHTPIYITDMKKLMDSLKELGALPSPGFYDNETPEVSGDFNPVNKDIHINIPPTGASPQAITDVIKHELVHKALNHVTLPTYNDMYSSFHYNYPQGGFFNNILTEPAAQPQPANSYNFGSFNRGGDAQTELPAYMSVYDPKYLSAPNVKPVTQNQRDGYMDDLFNFLTKHGNTRAVEIIKGIVNPRAAYLNNGLFPEKNVGEK